jgi:hypothetical protein
MDFHVEACAKARIAKARRIDSNTINEAMKFPICKSLECDENLLIADSMDEKKNWREFILKIPFH